MVITRGAGLPLPVLRLPVLYCEYCTTTPAATEVCNNIDDNCNGLTDDGLVFLNYYVDGDNDGYGAGAATSSCAPIAGSVLVDGDCDDNAAAVNPAATEVCNSIDDDCDGSIDESVC
ncbi:MAG: putative metal-binding motif-containing protein [Bacteroidetes bacterium]|nr:putative metal-binding motif-containing protein [Bacteroidota bacterium]